MHPFIETQKEWTREVPPFRSGDTLRVNVRVREGDKERLQAFEGVCIARRGAGVSETFTVRKISNGCSCRRRRPAPERSSRERRSSSKAPTRTVASHSMATIASSFYAYYGT